MFMTHSLYVKLKQRILKMLTFVNIQCHIQIASKRTYCRQKYSNRLNILMLKTDNHARNSALVKNNYNKSLLNPTKRNYESN